MAARRLILEMGMGNSLHEGDYTKAAVRAVNDAIRHSSLGFTHALGIGFDQLDIAITIGVAEPDKVDVAEVAKALPYGSPRVTAVAGGLNIPDENLGDVAVIASAAVEVFLSGE
ncbi:MAG: Lin0512 family protein [Pseudomonadota bacterium]